MKKILFATALFIGISTSLFAQQNADKKEKKTPEQRAEHATAALTKRLDLTESQRAKIYAINLEHAKKLDLTEAKKTEGKKPKAHKAAKKDDAQIVAVLNESQKKTYEELKAKHQAKAHHKGKQAEDNPQKA